MAADVVIQISSGWVCMQNPHRRLFIQNETAWRGNRIVTKTVRSAVLCWIGLVIGGCSGCIEFRDSCTWLEFVCDEM